MDHTNYYLLDTRDRSIECCSTPTCMCGEPNTTHCYACGKECKTCKVRHSS